MKPLFSCGLFVHRISTVQDIFRSEYNLKYLWFGEFKLESCEVYKLTWYLHQDRKKKYILLVGTGCVCINILEHFAEQSQHKNHCFFG